MSWRGLYFSQAARLSLRHASLRIERQDEEPVDVSLEDISYLILESPQVVITSALLAACAEWGCLIITCDDKHLPNGVLLPSNSYYQPLQTLNEQLAMTAPRKKRLWQDIIKVKIRNQASCLRLLKRGHKIPAAVAALEGKVKSGDPDNIEATAARLYWSAFAPDFKRNTAGEERLNAMLNYCYAIIRAAISRELVARGFTPAIGLHHRGKQNPFNLADDLIEPWRPIADAFTFDIWQKENAKKELDTTDKQALCRFLHSQIEMRDGRYEFLHAVQAYVASIKRYYSGARGKIDSPDFPLRLDSEG